MSKTLISNGILSQYRAVYNGYAWHGPNLETSLSQIDAAQALLRFNGSKNIAELVLHLLAWRQFTLHKLAGDTAFDLLEATDNFPPLPAPWTPAAWADILNRFQKSQQELEQALEKIEDELLQQKVAGREYDFYTLLNGIIQHDIYHLGQIVMLAKYA